MSINPYGLSAKSKTKDVWMDKWAQFSTAQMYLGYSVVLDRLRLYRWGKILVSQSEKSDKVRWSVIVYSRLPDNKFYSKK